MLRSLSLQLQGEPETQLPLTRTEDLIKTDDVLDLSKTVLYRRMQTSRDDLFIYHYTVFCLNRKYLVFWFFFLVCRVSQK